MTWEVGDALDLRWPDNTFDLVIDKSTIDTILHTDAGFVNVAQLTKEFQRVTKVGGLCMVISYGTLDTRSCHFSRAHLTWDVFKAETIASKTLGENYMFLARKLEGSEEAVRDNFEAACAE